MPANKKIIRGKDLLDIKQTGKTVTVTPKIDMRTGATYTRDEVIDALGIDFVRGMEMMGGGDKDRKLTSLSFEDEWKPEDEEEGE
jgi:hypothetical protein